MPVNSRVYGNGDGDQVGENQGGVKDGKGHPQALADDVVHGCFKGKGLAEIKLYHNAPPPI